MLAETPFTNHSISNPGSAHRITMPAMGYRFRFAFSINYKEQLINVRINVIKKIKTEKSGVSFWSPRLLEVPFRNFIWAVSNTMNSQPFPPFFLKSTWFNRNGPRAPLLNPKSWLRKIVHASLLNWRRCLNNVLLKCIHLYNVFIYAYFIVFIIC